MIIVESKRKKYKRCTFVALGTDLSYSSLIPSTCPYDYSNINKNRHIIMQSNKKF